MEFIKVVKRPGKYLVKISMDIMAMRQGRDKPQGDEKRLMAFLFGGHIIFMSRRDCQEEKLLV